MWDWSYPNFVMLYLKDQISLKQQTNKKQPGQYFLYIRHKMDLKKVFCKINTRVQKSQCLQTVAVQAKKGDVVEVHRVVDTIVTILPTRSEPPPTAFWVLLGAQEDQVAAVCACQTLAIIVSGVGVWTCPPEECMHISSCWANTHLSTQTKYTALHAVSFIFFFSQNT